jgi:alpha-amylase
VDWLNWLKTDLGFEGWRFDYVRGFAAEYVKEYIERTQGPDCFNVGENFLNLQWNDGSLDYNQDGGRCRALLHWQI